MLDQVSPAPSVATVIRTVGQMNIPEHPNAAEYLINETSSSVSQVGTILSGFSLRYPPSECSEFCDPNIQLFNRRFTIKLPTIKEGEKRIVKARFKINFNKPSNNEVQEIDLSDEGTSEKPKTKLSKPSTLKESVLIEGLAKNVEKKARQSTYVPAAPRPSRAIVESDSETDFFFTDEVITDEGLSPLVQSNESDLQPTSSDETPKPSVTFEELPSEPSSVLSSNIDLDTVEAFVKAAKIWKDLRKKVIAHRGETYCLTDEELATSFIGLIQEIVAPVERSTRKKSVLMPVEEYEKNQEMLTNPEQGSTDSSTESVTPVSEYFNNILTKSTKASEVGKRYKKIVKEIDPKHISSLEKEFNGLYTMTFGETPDGVNVDDEFDRMCKRVSEIAFQIEDDINKRLEEVPEKVEIEVQTSVRSLDSDSVTGNLSEEKLRKPVTVTFDSMSFMVEKITKTVEENLEKRLEQLTEKRSKGRRRSSADDKLDEIKLELQELKENFKDLQESLVQETRELVISTTQYSNSPTMSESFIAKHLQNDRNVRKAFDEDQE